MENDTFEIVESGVATRIHIAAGGHTIFSGAIEVHGGGSATAIQVLSKGATTHTGTSIGRTSTDSTWGVSGAAGNFSASVAGAGEIVFRSINGPLHLQYGIGASAITIDTNNNVIIRNSLIGVHGDFYRSNNVQLNLINTATGANNNKTYIDLWAKNNAAENIQTARLFSNVTDITDGSEDADFIIQCLTGGTLSTRFQATPTGCFITDYVSIINGGNSKLTYINNDTYSIHSTDTSGYEFKTGSSGVGTGTVSFRIEPFVRYFGTFNATSSNNIIDASVNGEKIISYYSGGGGIWTIGLAANDNTFRIRKFADGVSHLTMDQVSGKTTLTSLNITNTNDVHMTMATDASHGWDMYTRNADDSWVMYSIAGANVRYEFQEDGNFYLDGTVTPSGASDFAEYFESMNGKSLPLGRSVVIGHKRKVRLFNKHKDNVKDIIGVVSHDEQSGFIGNDVHFGWNDKWMKDEWGRFIIDPETGNHVLNPKFDKSETYIPRSERDEWNIIALVGQVRIRSKEKRNPMWKEMGPTDYEGIDFVFIR